MKELKIGCVIMAAGLSARFGRNKLLAEYEGRSLICRALDAVPAEKLYKTAVVTCYPEVKALALARNFECVWNGAPEKGAALTIRLGLNTLLDADAVLFMVSDQAALKRESVSALIDYYCNNSGCIVRMAYRGQGGNPCIFPSAFFPELLDLQGDTGGRGIIKRHEGLTLNYDISDPAELTDADYPADLP